jgi:hypothetical protein
MSWQSRPLDGQTGHAHTPHTVWRGIWKRRSVRPLYPGDGVGVGIGAVVIAVVFVVVSSAVSNNSIPPTPQRILVDADKISSPPSIVIQPQRAAAAVPAASGRSRSCRARAAQKQSPSPPPPRAPRDSQAVVAHHGAPRVALSAMASDKYRQQSVPCTVAYV